jgi:hypothetical protein
MLAKPVNVKPGENVTRSGQYELTGVRGGHLEREVTLVKNETVPPTPKPGQSYTLVDPSNNKSGE